MPTALPLASLRCGGGEGLEVTEDAVSTRLVLLWGLVPPAAYLPGAATRRSRWLVASPGLLCPACSAWPPRQTARLEARLECGTVLYYPLE